MIGRSASFLLRFGFTRGVRTVLLPPPTSCLLKSTVEIFNVDTLRGAPSSSVAEAHLVVVVVVVVFVVRLSSHAF